MFQPNDTTLPHPYTTATFHTSTFSTSKIPPAYIHKTLTTPLRSLTGLVHLKHNETTRLRIPTHPANNNNDYYLCQDLITFSLETLHRLSLYSTTRYYFPQPLLKDCRYLSHEMNICLIGT